MIPTDTERIYLSTPTMHGDEQFYISQAFESNWIAPVGSNCDAFEEEITDYLRYKNGEQRFSLSVCSGTAALHLAVKLAGIKAGDRVFCSDMTFVATVNPVLYEGGIPVFVDSERETWNMCPKALEKAFEKYPDTKLVILVHLYGTPAKVTEIREICDRHGASLIEDAAEALAATYKGRSCGTFGKYAVFSFNGNKIITTSGGGMLITDNLKDREKALFWATQSREDTPWYQHEEVGYNYRMSNILAGIGRGQLLHVEEHRRLKERIYHRYKDGLKDLPVTMNPFLAESQPNFWLSCMLIDKKIDVHFMDILQKLKVANIEGRPLWKPMHLQPLFAANQSDFIYIEETPVSEDIFQRGLCLPSDIKMTARQQEKVMQIIRYCLEEK